MTKALPVEDKVPNHWLRAMLDLSHLSDHVSHVLKVSGVPMHAMGTAGATVPRGVESAVLEHIAAQLNDPFAGARTGVSLNPHNNALLTYILFNSDTLLDALTHLQRFVTVTRPRARIELRRTGRHLDMIIDGIGTNLILDMHLAEFTVGALVGAFRTATATPQVVSEVGLSNPRRSGHRDLAAIYGCPVSLGAGDTYLRFSDAALASPIRNADPQLLHHLTSYADILLERIRPTAATLSEVVQRHLLHGMANGRPSVATVASTLGLSERTLNRRLSDEGTSFRALVSQSQLKLARAFLGDPNLSLAETAHLCGFSDQSSFSQAYRRWTGTTPKTDRKSLMTTGEAQ